MAGLLGQRSDPPVGFYFRVDLADPASAAMSLFSSTDNSFQEVSGLAVEFDTESVAEGGENRFTHKLPTKTKYPNLVLKRGLVTSISAFSIWSMATLSSNFALPITPKNIVVSLLNEKGFPSMVWTIMNAWPVKVQVSDFQSMENKIAVETMEFTYQYFVSAPTGF